MSGPPSPQWTSTVVKAAWTLLFVGVVAFVVWRLLEPLLPFLLVIVALVALLRLAVGWFSRDSW